MAKRKQPLHPDAPLYHRSHARPVTRRDFLRQGFVAGTGTVLSSSIFGALFGHRSARAALSTDLENLAASINCTLTGAGAGKIPFICFDLAGGANIAGSNVLVGKQNGQLDLLSTAGYSKLGVPGDMLPGQVEVNPVNGNGDHTDTSLGLAFHSKSAMLQGILEKSGTRATNINGAVIPARSENDTGNNPHNPMYGIAHSVKQTTSPQSYPGSVVTLIGSRNSDSGANSMAPAMMIDPEIRPTKVDRPSDVTGMVDTGDLTTVFDGPTGPADVVSVMESMVRNSDGKLNYVDTGLTGNPSNQEVLDQVRCGYLKSANVAEQFAGKVIDPNQDSDIVSDNGGIFSVGEFSGDSEFRKTASVMKMVIDDFLITGTGYAGAGTITMGGYDYHTGDRSTGETRDLRAGRCIGACLEYAARRNTPLMIYVYSDGSVFSNGMLDNSQAGGGKGVWTGDNQSTAASFFLVYNPGGRPQLLGGTPEEQARHQQIGWFRADGSVDTASSVAANNVNLLVETVILNYMALNGDAGSFGLLPITTLGNNPVLLDSLTAFAPLA